MFKWMTPRHSLTQDDIDRGMRWLVLDGSASQIMGVLTGGAFLVAFALLLGASNKVIGLLAAIGPITQTLQIPAIFLVNRTQRRKAIVVIGALLGRVFWFLIALLPFLMPEGLRLPVFLLSLLLYFSFGNVSGCAFNSWMRDLIPDKVMGRFFSRRLMISIGIGAVLSLAAGLAVDFFRHRVPSEISVYSALFIVGGISGMTGLFFLSRIAEPRMEAVESGSVLEILSEPFRNDNFRNLLKFTCMWNFAVNLAAPFFTVYLLQRLHQPMSWIIGLSVISQVFNVVFLKAWGRLADRFSNKSVLAVSGPLFMISIVLWPFTTMPEIYVLTFPLLFVIHALAGMSTAGVTLCAGNIALKTAPKGTATAYLATNALVSGIAASVAPIVGGVVADWFGPRELALNLRWANSELGTQLVMPAMNLRSLDFLFLISFVVGLYAIHRLLPVREEGEAGDDLVVSELYAEVRRLARGVSNIPGLRQVTAFPYSRLRDLFAAANRKKQEW